MNKYLINVEEFYNLWAESFYYRIIVDVRTKDQYLASHASMAVNFDATTGDLREFLEKQLEENPLCDKIIFYDQQTFKLSKKLKDIATELFDNGKCLSKTAYVLKTGVASVKSKFPFIWKGEEEEVAYPSLILPDFLYLGDEECSLDKEVISNLGITHVVSVLPPNENSCKFAPEVKYCQCSLQDLSTACIEDYFALSNEFIDDAKKKGEENKVLVHCAAGVSRSPTLVLSYLMYSLNWSLKKAYRHVLERRSVIQPNQGFLGQLIKYEITLFGKASMTLEDFEQIGH